MHFTTFLVTEPQKLPNISVFFLTVCSFSPVFPPSSPPNNSGDELLEHLIRKQVWYTGDGEPFEKPTVSPFKANSYWEAGVAWIKITLSFSRFDLVLGILASAIKTVRCRERLLKYRTTIMERNTVTKISTTIGTQKPHPVSNYLWRQKTL